MRNHKISTSLPPEEYFSRLNQYVALYGDGKKTHTKYITACHEAGHTLIAHIMNCKPKSTEIWIEDNGDWYGYTQYKSQGEMHPIQNPEKILAETMICCAGWVAEGILGDIIDHGSSADERIRVAELSGSLSHWNNWDQHYIANLCTTAVAELIVRNEKQGLELAKFLMDENKAVKQQIKRLLKTVEVDYALYRAKALVEIIKTHSHARQ